MRMGITAKPAGAGRMGPVMAGMVVWLLLVGPHFGQAESPSTSSIRASMVLKVGSTEEVADALVARLEALGGYFQERSEESVRLKVPTARTAEFLAYAGTLGVVAERSYETRDLGMEVNQLRARLDGRSALLGRYFEVLQDAGPDGVVTVEREITRMVEEIEHIKGSLRLTEHRLAYADVSISFRFRDRRPPARDGRSSFQWLNTMNLVDLLSRFRSVR